MDMDNWQSLKDAGNEEYQKKRYGDALGFYRDAVDLMATNNDDDEGIIDRDKSVLLGNMTECYMKMNKWDDAMTTAKRSKEMDPTWFKAYWRIGRILQNRGNHAAAFDAYMDSLLRIDHDQSAEKNKYLVVSNILSADLEMYKLFCLREEIPDSNFWLALTIHFIVKKNDWKKAKLAHSLIYDSAVTNADCNDNNTMVDLGCLCVKERLQEHCAMIMHMIAFYVQCQSTESINSTITTLKFHDGDHFVHAAITIAVLGPIYPQKGDNNNVDSVLKCCRFFASLIKKTRHLWRDRPSVIDDKGCTPLHHISSLKGNDHVRQFVARILLEEKFDVLKLNKDGKRAVDLCGKNDVIHAVLLQGMESRTKVLPECHVTYEGGGGGGDCSSHSKAVSKLPFFPCTKNKGHPSFIPVDEFKREKLPLELQTDEMVNNIKLWCDRTVKISVQYTSVRRPDFWPTTDIPYPYGNIKGSKLHRRDGTGHVMDTLIKFRNTYDNKKCPCHLCRHSPTPEMKYTEVHISTVAHVVFDDSEAKEAVFELFYDSEKRDKVKFLYGTRMKYGDSDGSIELHKIHIDGVVVVCVTHEQEVMDLLPPMDMSIRGSLMQLPIGSSSGVIISHPHGCSKHITIGNFLQRNFPVPFDHPPDDPFEIGPGAKFRISEHCSKSDIESFQRYAECEICLKPGVEYYLGEPILISLPPCSTFVFQSKDLYIPWVRFPPGTKIRLVRSRRDWFVVSYDMEFNAKETDNTIYPKRPPTFTVMNMEEPYFVTYSIDTCEGCSGSPLMFSPDGRFWTTHDGDVGDGTGCSAIRHHILDSAFLPRCTRPFK